MTPDTRQTLWFYLHRFVTVLYEMFKELKQKKILLGSLLLLPDNFRRHRVQIPYNFQHYSPIYFSGDPVKKNWLGGQCGTHGGEERCVQGFGGGPE